MKKSIVHLCLVTALAVITVTSNMAQSAPKAKASPTEPKAKVKVKGGPFRGTIVKVDLKARSITLKGAKKRVFLVTKESKIIKDGKPTKFESAVVGEIVGGYYMGMKDGKYLVRTLRIGPKPKSQAKEQAKRKPVEKTEP